MIRALQTTFQKHHKFVFFVLLVVIIVAFVFTIGAAPGIGPDRGRTERQDFFGYNMVSPRDQQEIARRAQISQRFQTGEGFQDDRQFSSYALERIAFLGLANQLRIPEPAGEELTTFIRGRSAFHDEMGRFNPDAYQRFIDEIEAEPQYDMGFVSEVVAEDFRIERARNLATGTAFLLPTEVRMQMEQGQTRYTIEVASFETASFDPEIEIAEEDLENFFEENQIRFQKPSQTVFSYANFSGRDFVDRVEVNEDRLKTYFEQNRARFTPPPPAPAEDEEEPAEPREVTFEEVRDQVETAFRQERSRLLAARAAADFAYAVYDQNLRLGQDRLLEVLREYNGTLEEAPPASREEFPPELAFNTEARQAVFRMGADRPYSDAIRIGNRSVVLFYRETIPPVVPPLFEVRDRVESEYRNQERQRLLAEHGRELRDHLREQVRDGQSFAEAAEARGLTAKSFEPFSLRENRPDDLPPALLQRLEDLKTGEISSMISAQQRSYFLYMKEKEIPEIDTEDEEFRQMHENMSMWMAMMSGNAFIQDFIEREAPDFR